jgi:hypothetical protein
MKGYSFQELVKLAEAAVTRAGDTMTGNLTVPKVLLSATQGTEVNALTRKDYVDGEVAKRVSKSGDTMTGNLTAPAILVSSTQNTSVNALTRKDYVDGEIAKRVSKSGDTMTGGLTFVNAASELGWDFNTDYAKIGFKNTADGDTDSYMWFKTGDNGNEYFKWQSVGDGNTTDWMSLKPTGLVVTAGVTAPTFTGALVGNAATATKLATARQINGTNFDGTAGITTANWGTARTLTIGNSAKSVSGAGDVSWLLSEIGAARSAGEVFSGAAANISTTTFVQWLESIGAFNDKSWTARCGWSYGANRTITDTGCGNIHLAGCTIEVISTSTSAYTIRVITPTTTSYGGTTGAEFVYVNNGPEYAPGWRRIYTTSNKPTAADVGLGNLANYAWSYDATAQTYAVRDIAGDLNVRLLKATYGDESRLVGAIAFRVNNSTDNYTRYCSDPAAVRNWMKDAKTEWRMQSRAYIEDPAYPMTEYHIPNKWAVITYLTEDGNYRISSSNGAGGETFLRARFDTSGNFFTTGAMYEYGQRVYSPNNPPPLVSHNHSAAQSNADIVAGGWDHVGAYVMAAVITTATPPATNGTIAGSNLRPSGAGEFNYSGTALPGTWRLMGSILNTNTDDRYDDRTSLFIRIA